MSTYPNWFGILVVLLLTSCSESTIDFSAYERSNFINIWMHTFEDGCDGGFMIFMPADDENFTLWRFRNRLELFADNRATYSIASPSDPYINNASSSVTGVWSFDYDSSTLTILDACEDIKYIFDVHSISETKLSLSYKEITTDSHAH